jgi:hypothetical protein
LERGNLKTRSIWNQEGGRGRKASIPTPSIQRWHNPCKTLISGQRENGRRTALVLGPMASEEAPEPFGPYLPPSHSH